MSSSREQAQHARGVGVVGRLLQQMLVDDHDGVGAEHRAFRMTREHRARLVAGQPLRVVHRRLVRAGVLGTWAGSTVNGIAALRNSSARRGEAEARIRDMHPDSIQRTRSKASHRCLRTSDVGWPPNQTLSYGATLRGKEAEFRVWAPIPHEITLRLTRTGAEPQNIPMRRDGEDFVAVAAAAAVTATPTFSTTARRFPIPFRAFCPKVCTAHPRSSIPRRSSGPTMDGAASRFAITSSTNCTSGPSRPKARSTAPLRSSNT